MKIKPKERLEGKRIVLAKVELSFAHANERFEAIKPSRTHILPWLDWATEEATSKPEDCYAFLSGAQPLWDAGEIFEYSIFDIQTKEFLGGLGVMRRGKGYDLHFEIGFWLKKDASNKGYMQEAVRLIESEFFSLGVERLVIRNEIDNIASKNVAIKLGYKFEGISRHGRYSQYLKTFVDVNVFAKLKGE